MRIAWLACVVSALLVGVAAAESINGTYLEVRNAEMWAGPCAVNAEIGLVGKKATLAWKVTKGTYEGVRLDGCAIVAVVVGDRTFGVVEKAKTQTVFVVDQQASKAQQQALLSMAKALAGDTVQKVIAVKQAQIKLDIAPATGYSFLNTDIARVRTRRMRHSDSTCGLHDRMAYPTLAEVTDECAAYTLENVYAGNKFRVQFTDTNTPSGVLAKFSL